MMNCLPLIFALTAINLLNFIGTRGYIRCVIDYCLNTSAGKKRRKGQSFKEWFFYTRYRDIVPKIMLIWYFGFIVLYLLFVLAVVILTVFNFNYEKIRFICWINVLITSLTGLIVAILFSDHKSPGGINVSRWIVRKKRNKK